MGRTAFVHQPRIGFDIRGDVLRKLRIAAAKREMTADNLALALIDTVVEQDLIDAVLDDQAGTK